jgi:hypothetical protein
LTQRRTGVSQKSVLAEIGESVWGPTIPVIPTNKRSLISVGRAAKKALKRIRKNAKNERANHLRTHRERLALRVTPKDTEVADAIKTIDRQLANQHMFGRIQAAVKPLSYAALTKVEIVNESMHVHPITAQEVKLRQVQTINTKLELESAIIERNKHHFAQAQGTPFTQPPLSHIGSSNGYNIFHDDASNDIVLPDSTFVETQTDSDILRLNTANRRRLPGLLQCLSMNSSPHYSTGGSRRRRLPAAAILACTAVWSPHIATPVENSRSFPTTCQIWTRALMSTTVPPSPLLRPILRKWLKVSSSSSMVLLRWQLRWVFTFNDAGPRW